MSQKLFVFDYKKDNKVFYKPIKDIYIKAIDINTGRVDYKKILSYSVHKNIDMYLIKDKKNRFKEFLASSDHSLICFNYTKQMLEKVTPLNIMNDPENYAIVKYDENSDKLVYINCSDEIIISYFGKTDGYDFTVEDYYTFSTSDGVFVQDTVAVYMPMTLESQKELREKVYGKVKSPATGDPLFGIRQGMLLGWYRATKDMKKLNTSVIPKHLTVDNILALLEKYPKYYNAEIEFSSSKTKFKKIKTSISRILFNLILPKQIDFINKPINKKIFSQVNKLCGYILDDDELAKVNKMLQDIGFKLSTIVTPTMSIDEMIIPESLKKKVDKLKEIKDIVKGTKYLKELEKELIEYVRKNYPQIADIFDSGSRGSWNDLTQMVLAKGYVTDAEGKIIKIPVAKGFVDNLDSEEYFRISPSARYGIVSRSINTDKPGYLTRRLVFAGASLKLSDKSDCKTKHYLKLEVKNDKLAYALVGRYLKDGTKITLKNFKEFVGKTVELRSPMYCSAKDGICRKCYGDLINIVQTDDIGIVAAQSIGERGTQLIMRTFHTGGVAELSDIPKIVEDCPNLQQDHSTIISKISGKMIIDKYNVDYVYMENSVIFKSGILTIEFEDGIIYDIEVSEEDFYSLELYYDDVKITDNFIYLKFDKGTNIIEINLQSQDMLVAITKVQRLFEVSGTYKSKKGENILKEIWSIYEPYGLKLVHFEVIISNMMRSKNNLYIPARLSENPYDHVLIGISKVPFYTSPILALGFQDINKAIYYGILSGTSEETPKTTLEKLMLGQF